ncbi:MAG: RluA family pseudouridine synthase [Bacilli bacterium]|nr:RluA family pseudouridine synthase [Bacilli bacterium]
MINVVYEDNHIIVVEKPVNIPVQADDSKDLDFLSMIKKYIKDKYNKPGNVYVGLVHRLDRPVGGIMVFAKTSKAASRLSEQVRLNKIKKVYHAVIEGKPLKEGHLEDYLLKDSKTNTTKVNKNGKLSILDYKLISTVENLSLVKVFLKTGRSHQIRVQFSSRNLPLYGDQRYNKNAKVGQQIALYATSLSFEHPTTKENLTFELDLPNKYPWNIHNINNF